MRVAEAIRTSESVELETPDEWVDWILRNYRRWCYSGAHVGPEEPTHCLSIEHQYVPKRGDLEEEAANDHEDTAEPIDERAGELVDKLILAMQDQHRRALRLHYVRWPNWYVRLKFIDDGRSDFSVSAADQWRARKGGMHVEAYLDYLSSARRRLVRDLHNNVMTPLAARPKV